MKTSIFDTDGEGFCAICNVSITGEGRVTCSERCHEELVRLAEVQFGKVKNVVDSTTGISYKVPTRDIIENGLKWEDLTKYPVWKDGEDDIETRLSKNKK